MTRCGTGEASPVTARELLCATYNYLAVADIHGYTFSQAQASV